MATAGEAVAAPGVRSRLAAPTGWAAAAALGLVLALPAVRSLPLHIDEPNVLEFAPRSPASILGDIFAERGGAPLQFFIEHFTLQWPGGIEGLRLPSLAFALAAVLAAGSWGGGLVGRREGVALAFLLASSPLAVELSTFGRMYGLFLACVLGASLLSLRAGRSGRRRDWLIAGAAAGGLVYVHPIAPLYAPFALASGLALDGRSVRSLWPSVRAALSAAVVVALPFVWALAVLARRYDVGTGSSLGATGERAVPVESVLGLTAGGRAGAVLATVLAAVGLAGLRRTQPRVALLLGLWVALPIAFFTLVPANTRFFVRYLVTALPPFLLLVAAGAFVLARWARMRALGVVLCALVVGLAVREDLGQVRRAERLGLAELPAAAAVPGALLFSSTGNPIADRPPEHLDTYVALRRPKIARLEELPAINPPFDPTVEERGRAAVVAYLNRHREAARGVWIFRGPRHRVTRATRELERVPDVEAVRLSETLLVVRATKAMPPRPLLERSVAVRAAWSIGSRSDRWADTLARIDREALQLTS